MQVDAGAIFHQSEYYDDRYAAGWLFEWPSDKINRVIGILKEAGLPRGACVLEFGCGRGIFANGLRQRLPDIDISGCDISSEALRQGRQRFPALDLNLLSDEWVAKNERRFDLIYSHHVLEHVGDLEAALETIARLLKPGGIVVHILPCANASSLEYYISSLALGGSGRSADGRFSFDDASHVRRLSSAELERACKKTGLKIQKRYFANQLWGGLDYLTNEYYLKVIEWLHPRQGQNGRDRLLLLGMLVPLLAITLLRQIPPYVLNSFRRPRSVATRALFYALLPAALLAYPVAYLVNTLLRLAREWEWKRSRHLANGSEMYLIFRSCV